MASPDAWIGPAIIAAAIAGLVNVLGLYVSGRRQLASERRRRAEKRIDIQTALMAEIDHYVRALANEQMDLNAVWADVVGRMEQEDSYIPIVPSEKNDTVFQSVLQDISILPAPVIGPVTTFYNQVIAISAMIEDLRSVSFQNTDPRLGPVMTKQQRIGLYTDYIGLKIEARDSGRVVLDVLQKSLTAENTPAK